MKKIKLRYKKAKNYQYGKGIIRFNILDSGNIKEITDDSMNVRINTYVGNNLESNMSNIYMVVKDNTNNELSFTKLFGKNTPSKVTFNDDYLTYSGCYQDINYRIILKVFDNSFIYSIDIDKTKNKEIKLFYGLDISIGNPGGIDSNESYISQYIDHKVFKRDDSYILSFRQNQGRHHYLEVGCLNETVGYSTDGFQFFGKDYKLTNVPISLINGLENKIYQYEFCYAALESPFIKLNKKINYKFYGSFLKDHDEEITNYLYFDEMVELGKDDIFNQPFRKTKIKINPSLINFDMVYPYQKLNEEEINKFYDLNKVAFIEKENDEILSFFTELKSHVVLPNKEKLLERPSGNLLLSLKKNKDVFDLEKNLATTHYIYGVFNSQIVYGNTSFNKLLSNQRNPLNLRRISGERIFIKLDDKYQLLSMPSLYEMGLNFARWIYKINDDYLIIENIMALNDSKCSLFIKSKLNRSYDFIITNHLTLNQTENDQDLKIKINDDVIRFDFDKNSLCKVKYPEKYFMMKSCFDDAELIANNMLILSYQNRKELSITIRGCDKKDKDLNEVEKDEINKYLDNYSNLLNHLNIKTTNKYIDSYNYLMYWLTHDALIHYVSPHGLEQYNGAAWGTRDVCQGPFELFKSLNEQKEMKRIIRTVYSHQFKDYYNFPQWFMFDRFINICDTSSHGDVILWPLRMVSLYLDQTNDFSILNDLIPYYDKSIMNFNTVDPLIIHMKNAVKYIENNFIKGTYLSCYGGGDWDDTLQPAKKEYKEKMVSGWTPELTYEVFRMLSKSLKRYDKEFSLHLDELANNIQIDFNKYIVKDGIPAGFLLFDDQKIDYIIHPTDKKTKLSYRLLPLLRAGLSEIVDHDTALKYHQLILDYLHHPDGVRLIDKPIEYHGGTNTYFQRAETASNFGREIGMMYCHAHIRYCELLRHLGFKNEFYNEFLKINPIIIKDIVPNAEYRQRNSYFSSSDAAFNTRYEVQEHFDKIKNGEIKVKGGWRVYSSGSGIFMNNFIRGFLGIEIINNKLAVKPMINEEMKLSLTVFNKKIIINYHIGEEKLLINNKEITKINEQGKFIINNKLNDGDIIDIYSR